MLDKRMLLDAHKLKYPNINVFPEEKTVGNVLPLKFSVDKECPNFNLVSWTHVSTFYLSDISKQHNSKTYK